MAVRSFGNEDGQAVCMLEANENRLGSSLIDINKYAPKESADIKNAIKKALNSIQKEFDEL